jgi:hypothetical protein
MLLSSIDFTIIQGVYDDNSLKQKTI